jgi:hypothetical protein
MTMNGRPSDDPLMQQLQLLLSGYGYNFYNKENNARADDLLVRERASYFLTRSLDALSTLRSEYQTRFIPPLTRENPFPPQEPMAQIREMEALSQELGNIDAFVRGMSVPSQDRIWWRIRNEMALLQQLLQFDLSLSQACEQLFQHVEPLTPDRWNSEFSSRLCQALRQISQIAHERERFLLLPL